MLQLYPYIIATALSLALPHTLAISRKHTHTHTYAHTHLHTHTRTHTHTHTTNIHPHTHTYTHTHTHTHIHTGASKVIYLILVAMVSSEACSRGSENECEAPRNNLDIKEKCIVVMMVTGTMFEMGEVSVVGIIFAFIFYLIILNYF